jgi:cephalosporin-C deacetylase
MLTQRHQTRTALFFAVILAATPALAQQVAAPPLTATPLNKNGIYEVNDKAGWTFSLAAGAPAPAGPYTYSVKTNNADTIKQGELDLASGKATLEVTLDKPAMLYVTVNPPAGAAGGAPGSRGRGRGGNGALTLGAAIAPTKLQPSAPRPADFDAFWDGKLRALAQVPMNPVATPKDGAPQGVELVTIKLDSLNSHAQGYLAKPAKEGKFPAIAVFEWAGVHALNTATVTSLANQGFLAFNVESHDMAPDVSTAPQNYAGIGNTDKEQSYFLNMYLRDVRAMEYLQSRPDWDGKTLAVMGTSMGGQQSFCTAGLLKDKVTHLIVHVPAGSDTNAALHGRQAGYPNWPSNNLKIMETALYFDPVNFAPGIKARCLVSMGFIDTIAPAVGIWTTFNQIAGPREAAPMIDAAHNNQSTAGQQMPYTARSAEWLSAIAKGQPITVNEDKAKPAH